MSNIYEQMFGTAATEFGEDGSVELELKSMLEESEAADTVKDLIDNAVNEANEEAENNLQNMHVIGMERLLRMSYKEKSFATEGLEKAQVVIGIIVAIGVLIVAMGKFFEWISMFSKGQSERVKDVKEKADREIGNLKNIMGRKLNTLKNKPSPEYVDEVKQWLKTLEEKVHSKTKSNMSKRIMEERISMDLPTRIREHLVETNKNTKILMSNIEILMMDLIKIADGYGQKDSNELAFSVKQIKTKAENYFKDHERLVDKIVISGALNAALPLFVTKDHLNNHSTDYSLKSLEDLSQRINETLSKNKAMLTSNNSSQGLRLEDLVHGTRVEITNEQLNKMSKVSKDLDNLSAELSVEVNRLEELSKKFKSLINTKISHTEDNGKLLKEATDAIHSLLTTINKIYKPNVTIASIASVVTISITEYSIAQQYAIEIDKFKKTAHALGIYF